jgi:hypothetical protein
MIFSSIQYYLGNKYKSAVSFCLQVVEWVLDMFLEVNFMKNHKIANNSMATEASDIISPSSESFWRKINVFG